MNLINDKCALKVENSCTEPTVTIKKGTHEKTMKDGYIFLKIMISRITIDCRSTVIYIRSTLSDLEKHMIRFDSNVSQFKDFVKAQLDMGRNFQRNQAKTFQRVQGHHRQSV